jgi:hypothetical protein
MTRAIVCAAVLAAAGAAQARGGPDFGLAFSIGFPIGDCGFGAVSIGTGGWGWGGGGYYGGSPGGYCGPSYPRYDCGPRYAHRGGRDWDDCRPVVVSPRYARRHYASRYDDRDWRDGRYAYGESRGTMPASGEGVQTFTNQSSRVAQAPAAAKTFSPAEAEANAWKALAASDPAAMEQFSRLVIRADATPSAAMGYAISAAGAGQPDRAAWATREALKSGDPLAGIPSDGPTKAAVAAALERFEGVAKPGTRDRAVVVAALKAAAGDKPGAARALDAAIAYGEPGATLETMRKAVGVEAPAPAPTTTLASGKK